MNRICPECNSKFETTHSHKKYCSPSCQVTSGGRSGWLKKKIFYRNRCGSLLQGAKNRSKNKNIPFDINRQYLIDLWEQQNGCCLLTGLEFNLDFPEKHGEPRFNSPSLDRINPELGYVKGNVRLIIYQLNMAIGPYGLDRLVFVLDHLRSHS